MLACPAESTNRSRSTHSGLAGLCRRWRVHRTYAMVAAPIGIPGCPELAACTASIESILIVLMQRSSRLPADVPVAGSIARRSSLMGDASGRRSNRAVNDAGVHAHAYPRRRLKVEVVAGDFDHHERPIGVEPFGRDRGWRQVARAQFAGGPFGEVVDPVLRQHALVHVVVAGEYRIHAVRHEERFEGLPKVHVRSVKRTRRVEGMMEVTDLPVSR